MGNDGGSIAQRTELVKTRAKPKTGDVRQIQRAIWFFCALSKQPLSPPCVACPLGKIYNKTALLTFLLDPAAFGAEGQATAGHIRSLKDVTNLVLTPNPLLKSDEDRQTAYKDSRETAFETSHFVCPITLKEMNGGLPFVYLRPSGAVVSELGLASLRASAASDRRRECPVTGVPYKDGQEEEIVRLHPTGVLADQMRLAWTERCLAEKAERASRKTDKLAGGESRKRKKALPHEADQEGSKKRIVQSDTKPEPTVRTSMPQMLAVQLEQGKLARSKAVESLYLKPGANKQAESWMTRGTYTRYAG
ncbi:uncharacterized protein L969DRAFT_15763 [Mixia osmundae IAM 14324]|uniref:Uncharacterized protein n=1 Tax=Mixia osmundae (strain CBS 9802 / IAM 14324 / JCM 22182 / KY 12970) TaxID=764103 RepID=G7DTX4_MIXOS|nr:uncharacterized protein L969DRAFT_15763 [Mixia osmundae IAM 14324]KEI41747.1 hypothetical protein L969DRAFT_15763 [Mixia osmundae IAM 14324]GAA94034.1 hypothetical protein E5Q_00681 [Mixia osmundae IAM 14324]